MKKEFEVTRIDLVKSSMIKLVAFHEDTTFVQFKNDTIYSYVGTNKEDYNNLINAKSVGAHLNSTIKGNFEYAKFEYDLKVKTPTPLDEVGGNIKESLTTEGSVK